MRDVNSLCVCACVFQSRNTVFNITPICEYSMKLLCVHLIKYQWLGASPSAVKPCTRRMIYFYQVFPLLGKCSADATALHFAVAVSCTYTLPRPLFFCCVYSETILSLTRTFGARTPSLPRWAPHLRTSTQVRRMKTSQICHSHSDHLKKNKKINPVHLKCKLALEQKGHRHALLRSWSLRSHPCFAAESASDWVTVPPQCPPPRRIQEMVGGAADAYETSRGLFSRVWCA